MNDVHKNTYYKNLNGIIQQQSVFYGQWHVRFIRVIKLDVLKCIYYFCAVRGAFLPTQIDFDHSTDK